MPVCCSPEGTGSKATWRADPDSALVSTSRISWCAVRGCGAVGGAGQDRNEPGCVVRVLDYEGGAGGIKRAGLVEAWLADVTDAL